MHTYHGITFSRAGAVVSVDAIAGTSAIYELCPTKPPSPFRLFISDSPQKRHPFDKEADKRRIHGRRLQLMPQSKAQCP